MGEIIKGYKTNNIEDHNITNENIIDVMTVTFNKHYKNSMTFIVEGIFNVEKNVVDKIQEILNICEQDENIDYNIKTFFVIGLAVKKNGFTLCFKSDQPKDIYALYENNFDELITMLSKIIQESYRDYKHKK